MGEFTSEIV